MANNPKIRLDKIGKTYRQGSAPAVENLSLDVHEGEILVLVGPSGCGKSTTLRLINRMIEPTSGTILLDGEDVTKVNPDRLRRRIGYVIQQIGLFPHQTIAENIATVPKMLKWNREKVNTQVDHLLEMVGLDPAMYRDRYPKELSGGQAQRIGVARALGADPEIMLMDEPFGAIDPITRDRLQNEFLRLQGDLRKTIVFVTHDIDEAIKMGDRIAILGERSQIRQLDTPERILAFPVDDFVDDFIGTGSILKGLHFETVDALGPEPYPTIALGDSPEQGLATLAATRYEWVLALDDHRRPVRWYNADHLRRVDSITEEGGDPVLTKVRSDASLFDTLEQMLISSAGVANVVDSEGALDKVVELADLSHFIRRVMREAKEHYERLETAR